MATSWKERAKMALAKNVPGAVLLRDGFSEAANRLSNTASVGLRKLPGTSAGFGPPRRLAATFEEWSAAASVPPSQRAFVPLRAPGTFERRWPRNGCAAFEQKFRGNKSAILPPVFAGAIAGARFVGRDHGAVIAPDDTLIFDLSRPTRNRGPERHDLLGAWKLPPVTALRGTVANLVTPQANVNYYHWLIDLLPRLFWLRQAGWDPARLDGIILKHTGKAFQKDSLALLGIPEGKIIAAHDRLHARVEKLVVCAYANPAFNADSYSNRAEGLRGVRDALQANNPEMGSLRASPERIYISRQRSSFRRATNGDAFERVLREFGFTAFCLEELSFAKQAALFSKATHVVALNGAGLANLIFAPAGTKVLEYFHPDFVVSYFWDLCAQLGHEYHALVSDDPRLGNTFFKFAQQADITVNCDAVRELLRAIA